jgi:hypothetical protein
MKKLLTFVRSYLAALTAYEVNSKLYADYDLPNRTLADDRNDYLYYCQCYGKKPLPYLAWLPLNWLENKLYKYKSSAESAWCETFGHCYEDHSWGGPDGGCVDIQCSRCGHGWHHQLY